ncbi:LysR substrate-binding domain-containing protein [Aureimonas altamirensis]|uniref:LysR substrate-binding domain-containing protein n=1 Tax=Aureimonas altamirensis TaxID=370622 RepID=UPI0020368788|nr:LysR substrate-binding domain-containing protein [Aureimonas altamirensis]MCM2502155.1 LysR substrate-binding domain-containing protein [Aureimonas altamirensis]
MSTLPPLSAIRVFEAVARNLSFSRAGDELGMSQAAVSYQIKVLEDRVGKLFHRRHRHIELTETGRLLAPGVREAFGQLSETFARAAAERTEVLSMTVVPTFASQWLAPHIGVFQMSHPDIAVRIEAATALEQLGSGRFDVAIRSGPGGWAAMQATRLLPVEFTPMVSPAALERFGQLSTPSDLAGFPLIDPGDPWWDQWFDEVGVHRPPSSGRASTMGSQHLEAMAAMAGNGAAILTPFFYRAERAEGRLLAPFRHIARNGHSYWLCAPPGPVPRKVRLFTEWLLTALDVGEGTGA